MDSTSNIVKVLILGGGLQTSHLFAANSGVLADKLRLDRIAQCTYTENLDFLRAENLRQFDVLLIYAWRANGHDGSIENDAQKQGLLDFVEGGKGLIVVHVGVGSFDDWEDYGEIVGRIYLEGQSTEVPYGTFDVQIQDPDHPTMRGLRDFEIKDELYQRLVVRKSGLPVLVTAQGEDGVEPMVWINRLGNGRIFVTALGHGPETWRNEHYQQLLINAIRWVSRQS